MNKILSKNKNMSKKSQQEMVGFILIVVLVVIGMMVFLVLSIKNARDVEQEDSLEARNMLDSILAHTTDCAIVFEPQFDTFEELFKSAYQGKTCSNKNKPATTYLNEELEQVLEALMQGEASLQGVEITFIQRDETGESGIADVPPLLIGSCQEATSVRSAQRNIVSNGEKLVVRLKLCAA